MTIIYLTDSDEEAIVDFVKDLDGFYDNTHEKFKTRPGRTAYRKDSKAATSSQ